MTIIEYVEMTDFEAVTPAMLKIMKANKKHRETKNVFAIFRGEDNAMLVYIPDVKNLSEGKRKAKNRWIKYMMEGNDWTKSEALDAFEEYIDDYDDYVLI